jgi:hypothetical protein
VAVGRRNRIRRQSAGFDRNPSHYSESLATPRDSKNIAAARAEFPRSGEVTSPRI